MGSGSRRARFPACSGVRGHGWQLGRLSPVSVGFPVAVHVAVVSLGHLGAVETVEEASGDLGHHGPVWDRLGHAVDRSLKQQQDASQLTENNVVRFVYILSRVKTAETIIVH